MIDLEIEVTLEPFLGRSLRVGSDGEIRYCCPVCHKKGRSKDKDHHLYLNTIKRKFICHRCNWSGTVEILYRRLGIKNVKVSAVDWEDRLSVLLDPTATVTPDSEDRPTLPEDYITCIPGTTAYDYLLRRGFTPAMISARWVGFGFSKHKGMVIFPEYDSNGVLLYWSAKPYVKGMRPKNCNCQKRGYLYWLARVPTDSYVVITESVFDSVVFGEYGVGILGSKLTKEQLDSLLRRKFGRYYLALDGDAKRDKQLVIAHALWQKDQEVYLINWPTTEDPSSIGRREAVRYMQRALLYHPDNRMLVDLDAGLNDVGGVSWQG